MRRAPRESPFGDLSEQDPKINADSSSFFADFDLFSYGGNQGSGAQRERSGGRNRAYVRIENITLLFNGVVVKKKFTLWRVSAKT
jgi:hypothetical protein